MRETPESEGTLRVLDVLRKVLMQSPDGESLSGAAICSRLYKECEDAKSVITRCGGLKQFLVKCHAQTLAVDMEFIPDQVSKRLPSCPY